MITKKHYTDNGDHPEDLIFRDKAYINRLQEHIDNQFESLAVKLRLNDRGKDWLFDYVFNESDKNIEFEEFLERYGVKYEDLVKYYLANED